MLFCVLRELAIAPSERLGCVGESIDISQQRRLATGFLEFKGIARTFGNRKNYSRNPVRTPVTNASCNITNSMCFDKRSLLVGSYSCDFVHGYGWLCACNGFYVEPLNLSPHKRSTAFL